MASDAPTPGCTQALVVGDATLDGRLLHARSMDWDAYPLLIDHPTIFVRQPDDGIPHVIVGFPANISPYQGMNAEGISIASNKIDPANRRQVDWTGRSHAQIQGMILKKARILDEARAFFEAQDEFGTGLSAIGDGPNRTALIYEVTANARTARTLERGVVWQTNHFVSDAMRGKDEEPSNGSMRRYERVEQLVAPNGEVTHYGQIDALTMVNLMRDRVNPWTHEESPKGVFEDGDSIATNGAVYQVVFDPEHLWFWAAGGALPVPEQPFVGFSLAELLGYPDAAPVDPDVFPPL
ncbi:MAG: C45 family peptidase [Deltaproteobacteria bacterium]|nr:C45 family peptidase [Deltaproteobacteria bacterium]